MTIAENRKAHFDYEILETYQAGIALTGHEVKSLKERGTDLNSAYALVRGEEIFVIGMNIASFQPANAPPSHNPTRTKKLLLHKEEIKHLIGKQRSSLTIIPLKIYDNKRGLIKMEIAVARDRKKQDKRELLKKREARREIRRFENCELKISTNGDARL